jgi:hypothetical protein
LLIFLLKYQGLQDPICKSNQCCCFQQRCLGKLWHAKASSWSTTRNSKRIDSHLPQVLWYIHSLLLQLLQRLLLPCQLPAAWRWHMPSGSPSRATSSSASLLSTTPTTRHCCCCSSASPASASRLPTRASRLLK